MTPPRAVALFTRSYPGEMTPAVGRVVDELIAAAVEVRVTSEEVEKHRLEERPGLVVGSDAVAGADVGVAMGGDGTFLSALRAFAGSGAPVFAFNYGAVGFLATVEDLDDGVRRLLSGDYETLAMPVLTADVDGAARVAVNDISFHRRANERVAELAYSVEGEQLGRVRCDGLVASTPAGSTGYNLANGGPVLAWGVEGFVVSFIAPHTLTARALVVATNAVLTVQNLSHLHGVDVTTDGRTVGSLDPGRQIDVRFRDEQALLAQAPGTTFYARLRSKFGHLAS
ncbi:MAG: NAD(+)/NADH kinase [Actinomycetota bacterium]|nr:NAD(+)/NADH kinase [Actinomycetota bacterium]